MIAFSWVAFWVTLAVFGFIGLVIGALYTMLSTNKMWIKIIGIVTIVLVAALYVGVLTGGGIK